MSHNAIVDRFYTDGVLPQEFIVKHSEASAVRSLVKHRRELLLGDVAADRTNLGMVLDELRDLEKRGMEWLLRGPAERSFLALRRISEDDGE